MVHSPHCISHIFRFEPRSELEKTLILQYRRNNPPVFFDLFTGIAPKCVGVDNSSATVKYRDFGGGFKLPKHNALCDHSKLCIIVHWLGCS